MTDRDKKRTAYETSSDHLAVDLFRVDEERAFAGSQIVSAEGHRANDWSASPNRKKSKMVWEMAAEQSERFLELTSRLPHVLQDIFYQYFLLGRTQTQIGELLGLSQKNVWQALELGVDGIAAMAKTGKFPEFLSEYRTDPEQREDLIIVEPTTLGKFILGTDDPEIEANFAPGTPDGPAQ